MEEEKRALALGWSSLEDGVVTVWMKAADELGTWRLIDAQALPAEGEAAVGLDFDRGALALDIGPPGTVGRGPQRGAFFAVGQIPGRLRGGADLPMFFAPVVVLAELVEQGIGGVEGGDLLGGKEGRQTLLPEVMDPLDLALGLRGGRKAQ